MAIANYRYSYDAIDRNQFNAEYMLKEATQRAAQEIARNMVMTQSVDCYGNLQADYTYKPPEYIGYNYAVPIHKYPDGIDIGGGGSRSIREEL